MSKRNTRSKEETEIIQRLQDLESQIKSHDNSQKKLRYISLLGICLMTCLMLLFVFRLYSYVEGYDIEQVVERVAQEAPEILQPELDALISDLSTETLPIFSKHLVSQFSTSMPDLKESSLELCEKLEIEIQRRGEELLLDSLITGLENCGEEVRAIFPEFSSEVMEKQIGKSMDFYVERLHDSVEERLALIISSLDDLKNTANHIGNDGTMEDLLPSNIGEAETQLVEALVDLVVYEIKPQLGTELANKN